MFKFNVGDTCLEFLPAFRVRLTPYGLENDLVGYFKVGNNPITVDVRWGEIAQFTFGGFHINAPYLIQWGQSSSFGLEIDTWKVEKKRMIIYIIINSVARSLYDKGNYRVLKSSVPAQAPFPPQYRMLILMIMSGSRLMLDHGVWSLQSVTRSDSR